LLQAAAGLGVAALLPRAGRAADFELPEATAVALARSGLVYISPLRADGQESRCHGEVWFLADRGDVLIATSPSGWKARALARGLDRARIWVGDFGRISRARPRLASAPSFRASARLDADPVAFQRLLDGYARKYERHWGHWARTFRDEYAAGTRVLIRYAPLGP
jgi:hypothetical protein